MQDAFDTLLCGDDDAMQGQAIGRSPYLQSVHAEGAAVAGHGALDERGRVVSPEHRGLRPAGDSP